jgi:hypothetical protein
MSPEPIDPQFLDSDYETNARVDFSVAVAPPMRVMK